jgi:hypothetical protein
MREQTNPHAHPHTVIPLKRRGCWACCAALTLHRPPRELADADDQRLQHFRRHDRARQANWRRSRRLATVEREGVPFFAAIFRIAQRSAWSTVALGCGTVGWEVVRARERSLLAAAMDSSWPRIDLGSLEQVQQRPRTKLQASSSLAQLTAPRLQLGKVVVCRKKTNHGGQ